MNLRTFPWFCFLLFVQCVSQKPEKDDPSLHKTFNNYFDCLIDFLFIYQLFGSRGSLRVPIHYVNYVNITFVILILLCFAPSDC